MSSKDGWHEEGVQHTLYIQNNPLAYVQKVKSNRGHEIYLWVAADRTNSTWNCAGDGWNSKGGCVDLGEAKKLAEEATARILSAILSRIKNRTGFNGEEREEEGKRDPKTVLKEKIEEIETPEGKIISYPFGSEKD